jgi:uncharacterized protein (TIRG00374 family)
VGVILAAVKYLNGKEVLDALKQFNYWYAPAMLALATSYITVKAWRFAWLMRPISNRPASVPMKAYLAGTAATLLPGGIAARAGLMNQAGMPVEESSAPVAYSSIFDQAVFVAAALIAAFWFPAARLPAYIILGILVVVALAFIVPFTRRVLARFAEWAADKLKAKKQWKKFLSSMAKVSEPKAMAASLFITIGGLVVNVLILELCLRGFGLEVAYPSIFLSYTLPTMFGRISALPAGIGVTEATMAGFLSSTAQVDLNTAVAATAIFRISTVFFQALLGALVYFFFWRGEKEKHKTAASHEG